MIEKSNDRAEFSISEFLKKIVISPLNGFFMGMWYPIFICVLVLIGHVYAAEMVTNTIIILSTVLSLLICPSIRPVVPVACNYLFQLSLENSPALPNYSDYCFSGWRLPLVVGLFVLVALAFVYFAIKHKIFSGIHLLRTPLLLPLLLLSSAFILEGVFSSEWNGSSLAYGAIQAFTFMFFFVFFLFGLRSEKSGEMAEYIAYVSALTVFVLLGELINCFLTTEKIIINGEIQKWKILFGWGVSNSMGVAICMLIPACFVGVIRTRGVRSFAYFLVSLVAFAGAVLTMSRNAMLFGSLFLIVCVIFACFVGKYKCFYRVLFVIGAIASVWALVYYRDVIPGELESFLYDNGRWALWKLGIDKFLSAPIFGTGFYSFEFPDDPLYFVGASFLPSFVHQTIIQLLASMGIFGLGAYLYYRASTVICAIRRPSATKLMLLLSALVMPVMSLIDTFIFNFWPVIHYSMVLAVMCLDELQDSFKETNAALGEKL